VLVLEDGRILAAMVAGVFERLRPALDVDDHYIWLLKGFLGLSTPMGELKTLDSSSENDVRIRTLLSPLILIEPVRHRGSSGLVDGAKQIDGTRVICCLTLSH